MDMLVNRLYRSRLLFGYTPQESQQHAAAQQEQTKFAYQGKDAAELSPLSIIFYTSAQDEEGRFKDLSKDFSESPFGRFMDDYSRQARQIATSQANSRSSNQHTAYYSPQYKAKDTLANTLELSQQQASLLLRYSHNVKSAYLPFPNNDSISPEHTIDYLV